MATDDVDTVNCKLLIKELASHWRLDYLTFVFKKNANQLRGFYAKIYRLQ
jgi:hypothetical protein